MEQVESLNEKLELRVNPRFPLAHVEANVIRSAVVELMGVEMYFWMLFALLWTEIFCSCELGMSRTA